MSRLKENIQYIQDTPVDDVTAIQFGHKEIALSICQIINEISFNFTIGIFGGWGTGKSTILNTIKNELAIKEFFFIFDVWKYKDDALRRTFISEFHNHLKKNNNINLNYQLSDNLIQSTEKKEEFKKIDYKKLLIPAFFSGILSFYIYTVSGVETLNAIILAIVNSIIYCFFFYREKFTDLLTITTINTFNDKYSDPSEFEGEFIQLLNEVEENKKIIIVFDNIDRVSDDKAIEVLSTIKTFLEPNSKKIKNDGRLIFLIPCDHEAIKQHVAKVYRIDNDIKSQESTFLEKFFNCTVFIPPFFGVELDQYTFNLLENTGISCFRKQEDGKYSIETHHTAWNIIKGNRNNPRQIKQFINDFLARYSLIQLRSNDDPNSDFEPDFCKNNISKIAKALIIQEKFPQCLEYLLNMGYLNPDEFVDDIAAEIREKKNNHSKFPDFRIDNPEFKRFKQFLNDTKNDPIEDFIPYVHGRISDFEKQIPGVRKLIVLLDRGDYSRLEEEIPLIPIEQRREIFGNIIRFEIERKQIIDNISQFFDTFFKIIQKYDIILPKDVYREIKNKFRAYPILLLMLSPSLIHEVFSAHDKESLDFFIMSNWIDNLPNYYEEVFPIIFEHESPQLDVNPVLLKNLNSKLRTLKENYLVNLTLFKISKEKQAKYLFSETIENLLINNNSFSSVDITTLSLQISNEIISEDVFKEIIKTIDSGMNNRRNDRELEDMTVLISQFILKFNNFYEKLIKDGNTLIDEHFIQVHKLFSKFEEKEKLLYSLIIIEYLYLEDENPQLKSIKGLVHDILYIDYDRLLPYLNPEVSSFLIRNHTQDIVERLTNDQRRGDNKKRDQFFITIFNNTNVELKSFLLCELTKKSLNACIEQIKNLRNSQMNSIYSNDVVLQLLNSIKNNGLNHQDTFFILTDIIDNYPVNPEISVPLISVFIKRFEDSNESQINEYLNILKKVNSFSINDNKRVINEGIRIIDRNNFSKLKKFLSFIIDLINNYDLSPENKSLCRKLFEVSISGINSTQISNVYGYLKCLNFNLNYEDDVSFYDMIINQISNNQYPDIRCTHGQGLLTIRPLNEKSEDLKFWEKVEKLKRSSCRDDS